MSDTLSAEIVAQYKAVARVRAAMRDVWEATEYLDNGPRISSRTVAGLAKAANGLAQAWEAILTGEEVAGFDAIEILHRLPEDFLQWESDTFREWDTNR